MKKEREKFNLISNGSPKLIMLFLIMILFFLINQMPLIKAPFQDNTSIQQIAYDCGTINTTNGYYRMNQSVTSTGTCFTVNANNITLDCNGNTITYSTGGAGLTYGISTNKLNTTIKNCNIVDGNWTSTTTTRYGIILNTATSSSGTIYNNSVNTSNSVAIYLATSSNNTLINNTVTCNSVGAGIYLSAGSNNTLIGNNGTSATGNGISLASSQRNNLTGNIGTTNSVSAGYNGINIDSAGNNTLTNNIGISTNNANGITVSSDSNILTGNNGTTSSTSSIRGGIVISGSNNTLINNIGTSTNTSNIWSFTIINTSSAIVAGSAEETPSGSSYRTFNPTQEQLENGYNVTVIKTDRINFKFNNETKTIEIKNISADKVLFNLDNKDYSIIKNETKKIDLNSDGYYDIQILAKTIYSNGRADLEIKLINEKIPAEEKPSAEEQTQTGTNPEKKNNYKWIIAGMIFLVLAFAVKILSKRKK